MSDVEEVLNRMLKLRPGSIDILSNRESSQLEFKATFDLGSGSDYARTMASFANNEGGYLVFGVQNAPHRIIGVSRERFEGIDSVKITDILNNYFSPEINWEMGCIEFGEKTLGYIYTLEAIEKPVIATKTSGREIREGTVYYRYRGMSTSIRYPELRAIVEDRLNRERRAWIQHIQTISKSGPTRVGIIDTVQGKLFGGGAPFLIDEKLLRQLKFVREGSFRETSGTPALRLVGDLRAIDGVTVEKIVHTGIHYDDLVTAFLAQRQLDKEDAKTYLIECAHQTTPYTPIFHFISQARITKDDAIVLIDGEANALRLTKAAIRKRLMGSLRIAPFGKIDNNFKLPKVSNGQEFLNQVMGETTAIGQRSLLYQAYKQYPALVRDVVIELPSKRIFEAISNLTRQDVGRNKVEILGCLLDIFNQKFQSYEGGVKTLYRKAVAYVEEQLYDL